MKKVRCVNVVTGPWFAKGSVYSVKKSNGTNYISDDFGNQSVLIRGRFGRMHANYFGNRIASFTDASELSDYEKRKRRDQKHEIIILTIAAILFSLYMLWTR